MRSIIAKNEQDAVDQLRSDEEFMYGPFPYEPFDHSPYGMVTLSWIYTVVGNEDFLDRESRLSVRRTRRKTKQQNRWNDSNGET
jgi:hypothetical protein